MGVDAQVAARTTRCANGASVTHHRLRGQGREIGVGAITESVLLRAQGLQFARPLPAPLQNFTADAGQRECTRRECPAGPPAAQRHACRAGGDRNRTLTGPTPR